MDNHSSSERGASSFTTGGPAGEVESSSSGEAKVDTSGEITTPPEGELTSDQWSEYAEYLKTLDLKDLSRQFIGRYVDMRRGDTLIAATDVQEGEVIDRIVGDPKNEATVDELHQLQARRKRQEKDRDFFGKLNDLISDEMFRRGDEGIKELIKSQKEAWRMVEKEQEEWRSGKEPDFVRNKIERDLNIEAILASANTLRDSGVKEGSPDLDSLQDQIEQLKQKEAENKTREFYEKVDRQTGIFEKNKVGLFERIGLGIMQRPEEILIQDRRAVQAAMNTFELIDSMNKMRKDVKLPEIPAENVVKEDTLKDMRRAVENHKDLVKQVEDIRSRKFDGLKEEEEKSQQREEG